MGYTPLPFFICPNVGRPSHLCLEILAIAGIHCPQEASSSVCSAQTQTKIPTQPSEPILFSKYRICSAEFTYLLCFIDQRLGTNNTCTAPIPTWKNMPMMAIIASLPPVSSALSFLVFSARLKAVKTLNPKSPPAARVPWDWSWETSQKAM